MFFIKTCGIIIVGKNIRLYKTHVHKFKEIKKGKVRKMKRFYFFTMKYGWWYTEKCALKKDVRAMFSGVRNVCTAEELPMMFETNDRVVRVLREAECAD